MAAYKPLVLETKYLATQQSYQSHTNQTKDIGNISNLERVLNRIELKKSRKTKIDWWSVDNSYWNFRYPDVYYDVYTDSDPRD